MGLAPLAAVPQQRSGPTMDREGAASRRALVQILLKRFDRMAQQGALADLIDLLVDEVVTSGVAPAAVVGQHWVGLQEALEAGLHGRGLMKSVKTWSRNGTCSGFLQGCLMSATPLARSIMSETLTPGPPKAMANTPSNDL